MPVCHRISFLYGLSYEHDRLNRATHDTLHELFGLASIGALEHLALMVRQGRVVTAAGEDAYLPHLNRLAIPLTFIHGAENACCDPESTARFYTALRDVYPLILQHLERNEPGNGS